MEDISIEEYEDCIELVDDQMAVLRIAIGHIEHQRTQISALSGIIRRMIHYANQYGSPTFGPFEIAELEAALELTCNGNSAASGASPSPDAANCIVVDEIAYQAWRDAIDNDATIEEAGDAAERAEAVNCAALPMLSLGADDPRFGTDEYKNEVQS